MIKLLLILIGIASLFISAREAVLGLRRSSFRARGGKIVKGAAHPVMFWLNFSGLIIVCVLGVALIAWSTLLAH